MTPKQVLMQHINPNATVVDIGSGPGHNSDTFKYRITIDAWEEVSPTLIMDLETEDLNLDTVVDEVLMIDFIEHIEKERGWELIRQAKNLGRRVWILTPLWWDTNEKHVNDKSLWCYGNKFNLHKSLWTKEELESAGFVDLNWRTTYFFGYWERDNERSN